MVTGESAPSMGVMVDAGLEAPLHAAREDVNVVRPRASNERFIYE